MPVELYEHQRRAVDQLDNGKILWGGVGTGKSLTAAAYYAERESPRDVYVITTAKKRDSKDWVIEFAAFGVGTAPDATTAGVLTVDSWNQISKYEDVKDAFFIFDEQRVVGSGSWVKAFLKIAKANRWIVLSATPGDTWLDYVPIFVANGFYKNRTEFIREHVVYNHHVKYPKVDRYNRPGVLVRHRESILVEMPYMRHTTRITTEIPVQHNADKLEKVTKKRWNIFDEKPLRDVADLFRVARKLVNTDPTRLSSVEALAIKHPRLIVFYNFDYELEELRRLKQFITLTTFPTAESIQPATSQSCRESERWSSRGFEKSCTNETIQITKNSGEQLTQTSSAGTTGRDESWQMSSESNSPEKTSSSFSESSSSTLSGSGSKLGSSLANPQKRETDEWTTSTKLKQPTLSSDGTGTTVSLVHGTDPTRSLGELDQTVDALAVKLDSTHSESEMLSESSQPTIQSSSNSEENIMSSVLTKTETSSGSSRSTKADSIASFAVAEWNGHKHEPIPQTDRWVYLVQYVAGAEGWNCTETDAMVFYSLTYSYKNWHQAFGRIDRLNTPFKDLYYYILLSDSWIDQAIMRSLKAKRNFNESSYGKKMFKQ